MSVPEHIEKKNRKEVLAIVLNWNELDLTRVCVGSLLDTGLCDVLVIDNASRVDPTWALKNAFPEVVVVRNEENLGVARGRSVGFEYALERDYEFVLVFDNDAISSPQMVRYLLQAAREVPEAGILGPKILRADLRDRIWRAGCTSWKLTYLHTVSEAFGAAVEFIGAPIPSCVDWTRGANQRDRGQYDSREFIDFQIGCAQLIRREVLEEIGFLDAQYSPYGAEDIDFCARARRAGWKILYVPEAICWHRVASSFSKTYQRTYQNTRNILLVARKNVGPAYFWGLFIPDYLFLRIPAVFTRYMLIEQSPEKLRGFCDGVMWNVRDAVRRRAAEWKK